MSFEYKFVNCDVVYKHGKIQSEPYQTEILQHARKGWRLVQIFVPLPAAMPSEYVLIFERPSV